MSPPMSPPFLRKANALSWPRRTMSCASRRYTSGIASFESFQSPLNLITLEDRLRCCITLVSVAFAPCHLRLSTCSGVRPVSPPFFWNAAKASLTTMTSASKLEGWLWKPFPSAFGSLPKWSCTVYPGPWASRSNFIKVGIHWSLASSAAWTDATHALGPVFPRWAFALNPTTSTSPRLRTHSQHAIGVLFKSLWRMELWMHRRSFPAVTRCVMGASSSKRMVSSATKLALVNIGAPTLSPLFACACLKDSLLARLKCDPTTSNPKAFPKKSTA